MRQKTGVRAPPETLSKKLSASGRLSATRSRSGGNCRRKILSDKTGHGETALAAYLLPDCSECANDPHIHRNRLMPADAGDPFPAPAQQPVCNGSGISPISSRNSVPPWAISNSPARPPRREPVNAPFLIAKQFCFQQRFGNRPAVDCNKRMRRPVAHRGGQNIPDESPGPPALCLSPFPLNQHRCTGAGHTANSLPYLFHLW